MLLISLIPPLQSQTQTPLDMAASGDLAVSNMASTYVPIESWVYPAIDRLASAGYVGTAFAGLRPWTRMDCGRLIVEARQQQARRDLADIQADRLIGDLSLEFERELRARSGESTPEARVESVNLRSFTSRGRPITDGYHSAQTVTNDYGRPYGEGQNTYTGVTFRAGRGPFAAYLRTEVQQSATAPAAPSSANDAIATADFTPTAAAGPHTGFTRGRLLEAYASFTARDNQFTFGKQSLWWGPGKGGPLLMSNNAEPLTMFRYDRVRPFEMPGVGRYLGEIRVQAFLARLSGQQFMHVGSRSFGQSGKALADQPFLHGQKVSFKPTSNFEFSVSRTVIFAGEGAPFTAHSLLRSLFSTSTSNTSTDPGDRRSAVDVQYRVPGMRNWLTAYVDTFTDDEPFPLNYPTKSAWSPGFYLSHLPHAPHMDLRAEGFLTPHRDLLPGFYYFNVQYLSGYTSDRQLLGSWIGRESNGFQLWSTWWLSSRSSLQASVRHSTESAEFLRGGNLRDITLTADLAVKPEWQLRLSTQQERWRFPILSPTPAHNLSATVQLTYRPTARSH